MRAVCFVKRLCWDLPGTVFRHGLTIGDVDNDGNNELVVGTAEGDLYIFKDTELWQKISGLGFISCVTIGDIFNCGRNALVVICGDGWAHVYYSPRSMNHGTTTGLPNSSLRNHNFSDLKINTDLADKHLGTMNSVNREEMDNIKETIELSGKMECVHVQRIPTNTKVVLVDDIDKDGLNEIVIGLTDRVVRSYRWSNNADLGSGKLVGLNKWECANQIGTVTIQHTGDGTPTLLVAQPGGTFMRIKCNSDDCHLEDEFSDSSSEAAASCVDYQTLGISRMRNANISTEILGDLEPGPRNLPDNLPDNGMSEIHLKETTTKQLDSIDKILDLENLKSTPSGSLEKYNIQSNEHTFDSIQILEKIASIQKNDSSNLSYKDNKTQEFDQVDGNLVGGNIILGKYETTIDKISLLPSYSDFIDFSHNNNNNGSKKNTQDNIQERENSEHKIQEEKLLSGKPYTLATLDGTIMLVKDEMILWAMQVDHHIFALCRLDVTRDGADEIIACTWDGQTYILDQKSNSVRFQFEEPVRAFCTGMYNVSPGSSTPSLVYNTFNNKIFLYYDVILPSMILQALNPWEELDSNEKHNLEAVLNSNDDDDTEENMRKLTLWLLYGIDEF